MRWVCACFVEFCAGWVFSARRRLARASVLGGLTVMPGSRDGRCAWAAPIGKRRRPGVSTRVRRLLAHTARISGVARTSACWVGSAVPMCVRSREILTLAAQKRGRCYDSPRDLRGQSMKRFIAGADRGQATLLPECLDDFIDESNPVRVIDAFVDALDLGKLGFDGVVPEVTGRPSYHPSALLKLYIYGYLNRIQSSRRLEREAGRNLEVIWLLRRLNPTTKRLRTSARTMDRPSRGCARNSSSCAARWAF